MNHFAYALTKCASALMVNSKLITSGGYICRSSRGGSMKRFNSSSFNVGRQITVPFKANKAKKDDKKAARKTRSKSTSAAATKEPKGG